MRELFLALRQDESGAAMAEYAILVAFIALIAIVGVTTMGEQIDARFDAIADCLKSPKGALCPS